VSKRNRIIYWIATAWLSLGMTSTGVVQLMKIKEEAEMMERLGYPLYFLTILGIWKLLGVVTVLIPKFSIAKEWAYAGFFFTASGAICSHLAVGDGMADLFGPALLLVLTVISWYFRPADRRAVQLSKASAG
jgi:hypothetical protein